MEQPHIIELARWLESPAGQYVLAWEQKQIDRLVANVFGYHAVQVGLVEKNFLRASRIRHKGRTCVQVAHGRKHRAMLVAAPEHLPFESQSIDLLVLPHGLECSTNPHQVLREASRVLMPEGRIIVSGFNPWSLWGARERIPGLDPLLPIPASLQVSLVRLKDWLQLLSFEVEKGHFGCYAPACETTTWFQRWAFMERLGARWWPVCGAVYAVSAVKRVAGMRLMGPVWKQAPSRVRRQRVVTSRQATRYQQSEAGAEIEHNDQIR
ncbi:MAG TPA: methyltransferase domain-containing protein [Burkholderiaceae bacterium]|nr:methyltransferase domain-containing protein [Burkholderiaceae bacterium]